MSFLENRDLRPLTLADPHGLRPVGLAIGKGANALEVVVAEASSALGLTTLRNTWRARLGGRATPLLLVVLYDGKAALCGPGGDQPPAYADLHPGAVERICSTALDEPDRHAALRFLRSVIPQLEPGVRVSGLRNEGLFATHELQRDVPRRKDWGAAGEKAGPALKLRGQVLVKALGYSMESLPGPAYVLRSADTKLAVAVFLERNESPDAPNARFSNLSAISYALAQADRENLDYVLISAGSTLRLYPARTGIGTGRRGRTETFIEAHLDLLPEEDAGYLWLLFSAEALQKGGSFEGILADSARYAADLGSRLRDRVYTLRRNCTRTLSFLMLRKAKTAKPTRPRATYRQSRIGNYRKDRGERRCAIAPGLRPRPRIQHPAESPSRLRICGNEPQQSGTDRRPSAHPCGHRPGGRETRQSTVGVCCNLAWPLRCASLHE